MGKKNRERVAREMEDKKNKSVWNDVAEAGKIMSSNGVSRPFSTYNPKTNKFTKYE